MSNKDNHPGSGGSKNVLNNPKSPLTRWIAAKRHIIWKLLNSPFGLFILTSVVVSGLSYLYQEFASYKKEQDEKRTTQAHLIVEIRYRLSLLSQMGKPQFTYTVMWTANAALIGIEGDKDYNNTLSGRFTPIYPDYGTRSLTSLIWELREIQTDGRESKPIYNADLQAADTIGEIWNDSPVKVKGNSDNDDSVWALRSDGDRQKFNNLLNFISTEINSSLTR